MLLKCDAGVNIKTTRLTVNLSRCKEKSYELTELFSQVINFLESLRSLGLVSQDDLDLADSVAPVGVIDNNADVALRLKNHNFIYTVVTKETNKYKHN